MEGLSELFNCININRKTGEISSNFPMDGLITEDLIIENKTDYLYIAEPLKNTVIKFISE